MYTLGLEEPEEPEIKLPTFVGSWEKQGNYRKNIYFCFTDYNKAFDCVDHNKLWKILEDMGESDHLTCFLRNLQVSQEATIEQPTGSKLGKGYDKAIYCHSAYLTSLQSPLCEIPGWMNHKLESRLPGEVSTISDDTTLMAGSEEDLKDLLMRVKREASLKLHIQKAIAMASSSITSQQREREKVKTVTTFIFLGSNIIVNYSHENKRCLLFGRKAMTNLESIFKSRDITFLTKVSTAKAMVFPVVTYGCESWTLKKAEC